MMVSDCVPAVIPPRTRFGNPLRTSGMKTIMSCAEHTQNRRIYYCRHSSIGAFYLDKGRQKIQQTYQILVPQAQQYLLTLAAVGPMLLSPFRSGHPVINRFPFEDRPATAAAAAVAGGGGFPSAAIFTIIIITTSFVVVVTSGGAFDAGAGFHRFRR